MIYDYTPAVSMKPAESACLFLATADLKEKQKS
jgi:hypothetical protein